MKKINNFLQPEAARDAYLVAQERGISVEKAASQMKREGWKQSGYDIRCGTMLFVPPGNKGD